MTYASRCIVNIQFKFLTQRIVLHKQRLYTMNILFFFFKQNQTPTLEGENLGVKQENGLEYTIFIIETPCTQHTLPTHTLSTH